MRSYTDSLLYEGSLKSFQDAVNLASIVSVTDVKGNIIYANELFCDVSKYTLDELIGKNHRLLNSGYHPPAFFKDLWQTISSGQPWRGQIKNRAKDGSYYWVDSVITPVFDDDNRITQYLSVRNIITDQKENENFRDSVFSALMVGIAVIDKDGLVVSTNNAWTEFSRMHRDASFHADCGENYLAHCFLESEKGNYEAAQALSGIQDVLSGSSSIFEMQFRSFSNQGLKFTSMRVTPFIGGGAVLTYYDITNEKKYQQEVLESKDNLLTLSAKVAKLGYWEIDVNTLQINLSDELQRILETTNITSLSQFMELVYSEDGGVVQKHIENFLEGDYHPVQIRIITRSNKLKWLQSSPSGIHNLKGKKTIYGTTQDITELKNYELQLKSSLDQLSERYEALMQFSYIVGHNLRSPIINLLELSNILTDAETGEALRKEAAEHIADAAKKLDEVTKDLSQVLMARTKADQHKEPVSFSEILARIEMNLEHEINESGVKIQTTIHSGVHHFQTIKSYMESIIQNLISNAIKYRSDKRDPEIEVEISKPSPMVLQIKVSDNGLGIDLKKHGNKVFNLYKRFHKNTEGRGLGLYMTKTQVEALGGKISVESEPDKGTSFIITFNISGNEKQIYSD